MTIASKGTKNVVGTTPKLTFLECSSTIELLPPLLLLPLPLLPTPARVPLALPLPLDEESCKLAAVDAAEGEDAEEEGAKRAGGDSTIDGGELPS